MTASQPTVDELLYEAVRRANALGWRTVSVARLRRLAKGDRKALPPDPSAAPTR